MHFNKAQQVLNLSYEQEQVEYFKTKIKDIENAATNTKSDMTWTIVNDVSGRKISYKANLKASNQKELISLWQKHFQKLIGCVTITADEEELPQINEELNIQKGIFTSDELLTARKHINNRKSCGLYEIPAELWKLANFQSKLLYFCNAYMIKII